MNPNKLSPRSHQPRDAAAARSDRPAAAEPRPRAVGFMLSAGGYAVSRGFRRLLAPLSLDPREFALLRAVASSEGCSQQAIGARLQIPASRMVAFVDALEARGLLERRHNPADRRARALHLTRDGSALLSRAIELAGDYERDLCAGLSPGEREQLIALLERIGAQLGLEPGVHAALADAC